MFCFLIIFQLVLRITLLLLIFLIVEEMDANIKIKEIKKSNYRLQFLNSEKKLSFLRMEKYESS